MKNTYATLFAASALLLAGTALAQGRVTRTQQPAPHTAHPHIVAPSHGDPSRGGGAPANDECSAAQPLTVGSILDCPVNMVTGNNGASMITTGDPICDSSTDGYQDVWYSFNSGSATTVSVDLVNIDGTDYAFTVQPTCTIGEEIACEIGPGGPVSVAVDEGTDYILRVYANTQYGVGGEFTLCVSSDAVPYNDECSAAVNQDLAIGSSVTFTGDNTGALDNGEGLGEPAVWETFTTTERANITVTYCGTTPTFGDAFLSLYSGCPYTSFIGSSSWDTTSCADGNVTINFQSVPGGSYYYPVIMSPMFNAVGPYTIEVSATACDSYCTPNPPTGTGDGDYITAVELESIYFSAPSDTNYVDNTDLSTDLARESSYTLTITGGAYAPDAYAAWIDYNNDFVLDTLTEKLGEVQSLTDSAEVVTINFTVPAAANLGPTRLRVRCVYNTTGGTDACANYTYGETEDYMVNIQTTIGIAELNGADITVFPNPSQGDLTISGASLSGKVDFQLTDMTGRTVYQDHRTVAVGQHVILPLNGKLAIGTYSLRMIMDKGIISRPVMIK